jgi:protein pelota
MKVIFQDLNHQEIKLMPENLDDIWHLYNIIQKNDLVRALTYRTDEQSTDKIRSKKSTKKRIKLDIRVEEVKFHEFSDRLRIHGIIEEGPQDKGSYHTLNVTAEDMNKITIIKKQWQQHELERIQEAVKNSKQSIVVFISLDEDTATLAILHQSGIQLKAEIQSHRSGKMYESIDTEKEYFEEIISMIKTIKNEQTPLVILGSGFTKDHLVKYGKQNHPELFEKCIVHTTGHAGLNGLHEAIKSKVIEHIVKENRMIMETHLIEKLFEEIKKNGLATYGENEVENALKKGAVDHLLISDVLVRTQQGEKMLKIAQDTQSNFTIINTIHEIGKKFNGIGGIAAILRYKI